ncbi:MAG: DUF6065 family protein [Pirellulaceae bacterium]
MSTPPSPTTPEDGTGKRPKLVSFFSFFPNIRLPQRADRSAAGSLPTRAFRYCEPATSASAYGYYVFPPIGFSLIWDGQDVRWTFEGAGDWLPLQAAQFPGFSDVFNAVAPEGIKGYSPPFLAKLQETDIFQMWTGLVVRTAPGWSLHVRSPANFPRRGGYEPYEGIIETDRWFGPLVVNIRLTKTDVPIDFRTEDPLLQVQPIPRHVYDDSTLNNYELVPHMTQLTPEDWDSFYDTVVRPHTQEVRQRGHYAAEVRKRRAAEARSGESQATTDNS